MKRPAIVDSESDMDVDEESDEDDYDSDELFGADDDEV